MLNNKKEFTFNYGQSVVTIETGRLAKQADGAVLVTSGETQVLVTVCSATDVKDGQDFFPLMVDYKEKFSAAGKFLGGFMKREGRPSNAEILLMRMIDRPLRPLFPEGYMAETIIMAQVLSFDGTTDPEVLAGLGTAASLAVSDIPFAGPVGFCKVGKIDGKLVLNPTVGSWENSDIELVLAASKDAILMVEGEANEVSEEDMMEALMFGHNSIKEFCEVLDKMKAECGKETRPWETLVANETLLNKMNDYSSDAREILGINDKQKRSKAIKTFTKKVKADIVENFAAFGLENADNASAEAYKGVDELLYNMMRGDILNEGKRIAGRGLTEVREIETEVSVLKRPHGSSLFTRGETQVLATATLGGKEGEQMADSIHGVSYDNFYLHYTFAPYSVGEARGYRGVGRREVGHGNLAERAIRKMMPKEDFPYTVRVTCEVTESNGSSSMGSVCSGSMALMDAGVPLKKPVAGVAMGLIKEGEKFTILTDILGDEDHLGDMDFKVAGTTEGITAIQMDIKITGITEEIFSKAMAQAKEGRLHILGEMAKTISTARANFKDGVPQIKTTTIPKDKIGALIGPGGKNIKAIQEEHEVNIEITDDGEVKILGTDIAKLDEVVNLVDMQINGPKIDSIYEAKVVTIKEYGAFVDIAAGVSGLVHVSEIAEERVKEVNDYLSEGDVIKVKVLEIDRFGKIKLSAKAASPIAKKNA
ncbi:MAG: polyribonucleotide nucleotidyltransferase [Bacteriovoracaceae bacterium]|jgi:polyribonucleotide nucleotidyltransferase|nr:polyribonucleotide nucleotidyltransferase [Bacteriovoracaceae bacterium]